LTNCYFGVSLKAHFQKSAQEGIKSVTKKDLIEILAKKAHLTKRGSQEAIAVFISEIIKALKKREKVLLSGFGTFKAVRVDDKTVVVPGTQERRIVKAHWTPRFVPGKPLKQSVRQ
jgi:DNA-binding protein HU-beta